MAQQVKQDERTEDIEDVVTAKQDRVTKKHSEKIFRKMHYTDSKYGLCVTCHVVSWAQNRNLRQLAKRNFLLLHPIGKLHHRQRKNRNWKYLAIQAPLWWSVRRDTCPSTCGLDSDEERLEGKAPERLAECFRRTCETWDQRRRWWARGRAATRPEKPIKPSITTCYSVILVWPSTVDSNFRNMQNTIKTLKP